MSLPEAASLGEAFVGMEGGMPERLDQLNELLDSLSRCERAVMVDVRPLCVPDAPAMLVLMRGAEGGLGRLPGEMDLPWMEEARSGALEVGLAIRAWDGSRLVGMIKASRMPSVQFQHVLWDLMVAVYPASQGRGIAVRLFKKLLSDAATLTPKFERVELVVREGLTHAIRIYQRLGFRQESRFERRFRLSNGTYEADLPMAPFI